MKKILFIYPSMIIGGSTSALLSFLNCLSSCGCEIDLQLFRNEGPLLEDIPDNVNLLPQGEVYSGTHGKLIKLVKFFLSGFFFKSIFDGLSGNAKKMFSLGVATDFQAICLSRKSLKYYDCAIGYLEGWSNRYLAFQVNAGKKYAWLHSTFKNITSEPQDELKWMKKVDNIVFVTNACCDDFKRQMPSMADKAITIENIIDSNIIRKRSMMIDNADEYYKKFVTADSFKIITVCRLSIQVKGLDRIVTCANRLMKNGNKFLWYIIGDGEDKKELNEMIKKFKLEEFLVLTGNRMNPYPFIAASDVMCMPSRYEGKPVTVTESLILSVPPIVTEYLSANEQIQNGIDGIVVENDDNSIFAPLENCIRDDNLVAKLKKNIRKKEYGNINYVKTLQKICFGEN